MANLPGIAQRLNDVEINNNKPVSSQTNRRVGSSVNYLLDHLNIANAATSSGPTSALTVFSPREDISYSYSFLASDFNVTKTLFTFPGGGDRILRFFRPDNGFGLSEVSQSRGDPGAPLLQNYPILQLLKQLAVFTGVTVQPGHPLFIVSCNGIEMGRTIRGAFAGPTGPPLATLVQYIREIHRAPAGTNTVTVLSLGAPVISSLPVSASFSYIAT